jgi:hypothetical protein
MHTARSFSVNPAHTATHFQDESLKKVEELKAASGRLSDAVSGTLALQPQEQRELQVRGLA